MSVKKILILCVCFFFFTPSLRSEPLSLLDLFKQAKEGDFVVFEQQKLLTLFRVAKHDEDSLTIEEVTCALHDKPEHSWQEWLLEKAPKATSWTLSTFQKDGQLASIFSVSTSEWIETDKTFTFLSTLFQLDLTPVKEELLKRVGPPPEAGEQDRRKLWMPKIIIDGKAHEISCRVFQTRWPYDDTELSGTLLHLYFPTSGKALNYFPYVIEAIGKISRVKLRVIDSGHNLTSPVEIPSNR